MIVPDIRLNCIFEKIIATLRAVYFLIIEPSVYDKTSPFVFRITSAV